MYYNREEYSIYYEKYGNNEKTILILPGWGDTRKTFYNIINILKEDYTIYIIDYPGFGKSIFPNKDLTIYDYTNIIRSFLTDFNIVNPIIIAHSFGGRIATVLTGYYKEKIDKLIMIDTAGIKHKKGILKWLKEKTYKLLKLIKYILPKNKRKNYIKKLLNIFGSIDYKNLNDYMRKTFQNIIQEDLKYYLKEVNTETLLIWGKLDESTPLKDGKIMNKLIENSALIVFPNGNHFTYLQYPILITNIIKEFIKETNI